MNRALLVLCLAASLGGCLSDDVKETAETVLTLQTGTMSELRERRGDGPFTTYDLPPAAMLGVVAEAARRARNEDGQPVRAVFLSERRGEVVAKERRGESAESTSYEPPFLTAMLAIVHPVRDHPGQSRVEIHEIGRGPFHRGAVRWVRDMPGWIEAVLAERDRPLEPIP